MGKGLKLKAQDNDDLTIISAYLQDAVTVVADFNYSPSERIFAVMLNRYLWEDHKASRDENGNKSCHRIRTGCHFENVTSVSSQNFQHKDKKHILELLAIESKLLGNKNIAIDLIFSGDEVIRLEAELIEASMQDIGEPYPAACHPKHDVLETLSD
ncbi:MAG: DUF2948 family protein [Kordiimonadaceae bacterium]|jgi:hypothetical protein|nr:DUF2948 family protein [Rhodospirillaceae bacterium]MBT5073680.1 DUF2948 family protein [Kordiimonadaceae bacterium]MBT6036158.1 DUF2948 family protein [Kordiimonadaceae bacterium]MBT6330750.1 DUF2948 family protein [Kordiimonadaceae bacterium]